MTGIKYLLLDLDGTLLNFDQRIFVILIENIRIIT